jgi:hypothetical protein
MIPIYSIDEANTILTPGDFVLLDDSGWDCPYFLVEVCELGGKVELGWHISCCILRDWSGLGIRVGQPTTLTRGSFLSGRHQKRRVWKLKEGDEFWNEACAVSMKLALITKG